MILGALWYSPVLFGKQWMKLSGYTMKDLEKAKKDGGMGMKYFLAFVANLVMAYVVAVLIDLLDLASFGDAARVLLWLWLGLMVPILLNLTLWDKKPWGLLWLNASYYLVGLFVIAGVLLWM